MEFKRINDYEILYLINEGNELALNFMFDKYEPLIKKLARGFYKSIEMTEDLIQEGRIILLSCIKGYSSYFNISFVYYFTICLKRGLREKSRSSYYEEFLYFEEDEVATMDYSKSILARSEALLDTKEEKELYHFVVLDGMSLSLYARKKHLSYGKVHYQYTLLIEKLKKLLN